MDGLGSIIRFDGCGLMQKRCEDPILCFAFGITWHSVPYLNQHAFLRVRPPPPFACKHSLQHPQIYGGVTDWWWGLTCTGPSYLMCLAKVFPSTKDSPALFRSRHRDRSHATKHNQPSHLLVSQQHHQQPATPFDEALCKHTKRKDNVQYTTTQHNMNRISNE
mmetsp:Transcript_20259/g.56451  ORF Transcript_20259/g.56451 Transcript_20259/m.56451 type:complete len:163 (-) Transcript_20259:66-554(-)